MDEFTPEELMEARRALISLRNKNDKASGKLKEGSWQLKMTAGIVKASDTALRLIDGTNETQTDKNSLDESRVALLDALHRANEVVGKFAVGTSQRTLQERRIRALEIAISLIEKEQRL
jgi:hypothetical protein